MSAPAASGPAFAPSSPELRSDTPRVGTHEAVTVATPPFPSGEVTPGFEPCPPQNVAVCPACLDPVLPEGAGPATACRWPVCGHSYHALCLARSRAHVQRMQCALCRQGWRPAFDSDLEALCGQLGIDWHALQLHDPVPVQPAPSAGVASDDADVAMAPAAPELDAFVTAAPVAPANLVEPAPPLAEGQVPPVNSWFFVPLLLAGGGLLLQNAERQWSAHPVLAVGWQAAVSQLRRSPRVPLSRFLSVLETLQDVAALDGRRVPAAEALLVPSLREAGTALPTHTLVHFRWVLERYLTPHSYVPASAQEALLQVFLNERAASDCLCWLIVCVRALSPRRRWSRCGPLR